MDFLQFPRRNKNKENELKPAKAERIFALENEAKLLYNESSRIIDASPRNTFIPRDFAKFKQTNEKDIEISILKIHSSQLQQCKVRTM